MNKKRFYKNRTLVINQHRLHRALRLLVQRNGTECYGEDRVRAHSVVKHYKNRYHISGSIVDQFWTFFGFSVLTGKAN